MSKLTTDERYGLASVFGMAACALSRWASDPNVTPQEREEVRAALDLLGWSVPTMQSMHAVGHEITGLPCE